MDPLALVAAAVAAGAATGSANSQQVLRDSYSALRNLITHRYASVDVCGVEQRPTSAHRRAELVDDLIAVGAVHDEELLAAAREVLRVVQRNAPNAAETVGVRLSRVDAGKIEIFDIASGGSAFIAEDTKVAGTMEVRGVRAAGMPTVPPFQRAGVTRPAAALDHLQAGVVFSGVTVGGDLITSYHVEAPTNDDPVSLADVAHRLNPHGELPTVSELDAYLLGSTRPPSGGVGDTYVPRTCGDVDGRLAAALAGDRMVLLVGPSKAGKTRALFHALEVNVPAARVMVASPESLAKVPACREYRDCADPVVVWLDDLDRYLTASPPLTPALLARLTTRRGRTVVVGTLRSEVRARLRHNAGESDHVGWRLIEHADQIDLAPTSEDPEEREAAAAAFPALDHTRFGLGEMLVGAPALLHSYFDARYHDPVLFTVIQVAIDWARIGRSDPIPESTLTALAVSRLEDQHAELEINSDQIQGAIASARSGFSGVRRVAALETTTLPDRSRGYRAFDYLVAADDGQNHSVRPIPTEFWCHATEGANTVTLTTVGHSALQRKLFSVAKELWTRAATADHGPAMILLGMVLSDRGEHTESEQWLIRAIDLGHEHAKFVLGRVLEERGNIEEAESWYRQAVVQGDINAMNNLGVIANKKGDNDSAETLWRQAALAGQIDAAANLASSLHNRGDTSDIEQWWRRAAEGGKPHAMLHLASILRIQQNTVEADAWYRRAANPDTAETMFRIATDAHARHDKAEAEYWYRRAIDNGQELAYFNLGSLLFTAGKFEESFVWALGHAEYGDIESMTIVGNKLQQYGETQAAEIWYRRAAEEGDTTAMLNLGGILRRRGELAEAEAWWRRSAEGGEVKGMNNLGVLLHARGDSLEAEIWWRRCAQTGDAAMMGQLGALLRERGELAEAEQWLLRAAQKNESQAMAALGNLLSERGQHREAEEWWQRAAQAGDTPAMFSLAFAHAERGETSHAERWYRQAAEHDHPGAMINLGVLLSERGQDAEAEPLYRRAAEKGFAKAMANLANLLDRTGKTTEAEQWRCRAEEKQSTTENTHATNEASPEPRITKLLKKARSRLRP